MAKERESRFDFFRIGVITAFLKSVGNTSGSGSRDEHVLVSLRREFISKRGGDMSCSRHYIYTYFTCIFNSFRSIHVPNQ